MRNLFSAYGSLRFEQRTGFGRCTGSIGRLENAKYRHQGNHIESTELARKDLRGVDSDHWDPGWYPRRAGQPSSNYNRHAPASRYDTRRKHIR